MPLRPPTRALGRASTVLLLSAALAACGGDPSGSAQPAEPVELDGDASAAPAEGSDEQQLRDLVAAYDAALDEVQRLEGDPAAFDGVLTDDLATSVGGNYRDNIYGNGSEVIGSWVIEAGEVELDGDRATVEVCTDGRDVYVVPAGSKIGPGDTNQGRSPQVLTGTREDGRWLIAGTAAGGEACR